MIKINYLQKVYKEWIVSNLTLAHLLASYLREIPYCCNIRILFAIDIVSDEVIKHSNATREVQDFILLPSFMKIIDKESFENTDEVITSRLFVISNNSVSNFCSAELKLYCKKLIAFSEEDN